MSEQPPGEQPGQPPARGSLPGAGSPSLRLDAQSWIALVGEVGEHGGQLRGLRADVDHVTDAVLDILRPASSDEDGDAGGRLTRLENLHGVVAQLAQVIEGLGVEVEKMTAAAATLKVPNWSTMSPEEVQAELGRLNAWVVRVLRPRYLPARPASVRQERVGLYGEVIADCWQQHPEVVEELSVLRVAWIAAYEAPGRRWNTAADFVDRWLPGTMSRVADRLAGCKAGHHRGDGADQEEQPPARRPAPGAAATTPRRPAQPGSPGVRRT